MNLHWGRRSQRTPHGSWPTCGKGGDEVPSFGSLEVLALYGGSGQHDADLAFQLYPMLLQGMHRIPDITDAV